MRQFEEVFSERVWEWAKVLLIGAILAPGERTVTAILRVMGLSREQQFQNYHRVFNHAKWSSRALSRILLRLLVHIFVPGNAPIVVGIDETIERRRGAKIETRGIYRDPVRSVPRVLCQNQRLALGINDAAHPHSVGAAGVGLAISHGACSFRALL